jgi:hypothetical protein
MQIRRACLFTLLASLGACAAPQQPGSVPIQTSYAARFVGAWRVTIVDEAQMFDDYSFGDAGKLTRLASVANGQPVDPMSGASVVRCTSAPMPACTFGQGWRSTDADTLVVDGQCTDGTARAITLAFSDETHAATVTLADVGGEAGWAQPDWRFEKCDQHACN